MPTDYVKNGRRAVRRKDGTFKRWEEVRKNPSSSTRKPDKSGLWMVGGLVLAAIVGLHMIGPLTSETEVVY